MKDYSGITSRDLYYHLIDSGMFWEFYPELTGTWEEDKKVILAEEGN